MSVSCGVLEVSVSVNVSGCFTWLRRPQDETDRPGGRQSDEAVLAQLRAIHAQVKGEHGWPRMHRSCWPGAFGWARTGCTC